MKVDTDVTALSGLRKTKWRPVVLGVENCIEKNSFSEGLIRPESGKRSKETKEQAFDFYFPRSTQKETSKKAK